MTVLFHGMLLADIPDLASSRVNLAVWKVYRIYSIIQELSAHVRGRRRTISGAENFSYKPDFYQVIHEVVAQYYFHLII